MKEIGILGAGVAGLSLALAFENQNINFKLFDQKSVLKDTQHGMILWPGAVNALNELGLLPQIEEKSQKLNKYILKDRSGKTLQEFDLSNYKGGILSLSKSDLIDILSSKVSKHNMELNTPYYSYKAAFGKSVKVDFHSGEEREFDYLFAADGAMSPIRIKVAKDGKPEYAGYTIWRGYSNENYHGLSSDEIVDYIDAKRRFIVQPTKEGFTWWAISFESNKFQHQSGNRRKKMSVFFRDWPSEIMDFIMNSDEDQIIKTAAFLRDPELDFMQERVILTGDASMLFSPILGKGASYTIEENLYLAKLINSKGINSRTLDEFSVWRKSKIKEIFENSNTFANAANVSTLLGMLFGKSLIANKVRRALTLQIVS